MGTSEGYKSIIAEMKEVQEQNVGTFAVFGVT